MRDDEPAGLHDLVPDPQALLANASSSFPIYGSVFWDLPLKNPTLFAYK